MSGAQPGSQQKSYKEIKARIEADNPTWHHFHRRAQINKWVLAAVGLFAVGFVAGGLADGWESWVSFAWAAGFGAVAALVLGFLGYRASSVTVHLERPKRRFNVTNGFNATVRIPLGGIAYIGKAEFTRKDLFRLTRLRLLNESGPGLEIVANDGKYVTISTTEGDAIIKAALESGMNPNAVRIPFPENAVNEKWRDTRREQRPAPGRPAA
ncbi:phage holin family protein [Nocardiopsis sp. RSe5-2]|uniref:Phage holin family protein n=1 Tax=Nocardiopsis endophytica TaxID=3018445 RepID=A0ABT4U4L1_9ACTN|nr:phage holin family protein [Nocardiopsis endophytica]MDA2811870.1 phage holin family protein [Nocardiopsis endophytica]